MFSKPESVVITNTNNFELLGAELAQQQNFSWDNAASAIILKSSRGEGSPARGYDSVKRLIDIIGAFTLLLALSPVIVVVAAFVKLSSSGPVFYSQVRLTEGSRQFRMIKFRTMIANAEGSSGAVWAATNDPRVTTVGKFLRSSRLDELPQLVNVLKGEMSLIGPRPERPEFAETLEEQLPQFGKRLAVKGGITGLAQVSAGYAACIDSYREKLALDLLYIKNRSLLLDLSIALQTVKVVLTGNGAR